MCMFRILNGDKHFFQWDLGQKLIVDSGFCRVHFCNDCDGCTYVTEVKEANGIFVADVPNILLQSTENIRVYGICKNAPDVINTRNYKIFRVIPRGKPENYIYTETEVLNYNKYEERLAALENTPATPEGTMIFKGVVSALPETANNGEVYKLVNECYSVPINATDIVDDGSMLVFRTDTTSAFYKFISFTKDCLYGDNDTTNYQTVNSYYYPNGKKTSFPWIYSTWHEGEGSIAMPSDETFYKELVKGGNMGFNYSDASYLPDDLKSYAAEMTAVYVYYSGKFIEL